MGNRTYDEWKKAFDADSDTDAQFMKYIIVGKVDEHTALLNADVFAPKKWKQWCLIQNFKKLSLKWDLSTPFMK